MLRATDGEEIGKVGRLWSKIEGQGQSQGESQGKWIIAEWEDDWDNNRMGRMG